MSTLISSNRIVKRLEPVYPLVRYEDYPKVLSKFQVYQLCVYEAPNRRYYPSIVRIKRGFATKSLKIVTPFHFENIDRCSKYLTKNYDN